MQTPTFKPLPLENPPLFGGDNPFAHLQADHPVRLVSEVVDLLDLSELIAQYKGGGTSSFHPRMMVKVLFYAYFSNIYSSRKIEYALHNNMDFIWISGNSKPDHRTIHHFRSKRLAPIINRLFAQVVHLLAELDYISLDLQYIDGTIIESAANGYTFTWRKNTERNKAKLELKIQALLHQIETDIAQDTAENTPSTPIDSAALAAKLADLNTRIQTGTNKPTTIDKAAKKQLNELSTKYLPKLKEYEEQLVVLDSRNSYSKTDPSATFMRLKADRLQTGQLKPAYNVQISAENQFITHFSIGQSPNDGAILEDHLDGFEQQHQKQSKIVVADAGYGSEENYQMMQDKQIEAFVKYPQYRKEHSNALKNNPFQSQNFFYNPQKGFMVCPMGQRMYPSAPQTETTKSGYVKTTIQYQAKRCQTCPLRPLCNPTGQGNRTITISPTLVQHKQNFKQRAATPQGQAYLKKRSVEVEPIFGQIKYNNNFNRFTLKGSLDKIYLEFGLVATAHNLRKLSKKGCFIKPKQHIVPKNSPKGTHMTCFFHSRTRNNAAQHHIATKKHQITYFLQIAAA